MGVIQRQGIKHSIVNFTGLILGTASTIFIYSQRETVEAYGLVQYLLSIGIIGYPLFALSGQTVAIRFFPHFQNKSNGHNGLLPLLLLLCLAGWGISAVIAVVFWSPISAALTAGSPLLQEYLWMALPLALFYTLAVVLSTYCVNFKRIVVPSILIDFSLKLFLPLQMVALWQGWISLQLALWLLLAHYVLMMTGMVIYLRALGEWQWQPRWSFLTPALRAEIGRYAGFGMITGFALLLATKADTLMVGTLATIKGAGIYAIALNIAAAVEIPGKSLYSASASFVARYLADENWAEMKSLYQKVSINLLSAGLLLFGCIWVSAEQLYEFMPNSAEVSKGKYVLLFLCIAKLVDMTSGLNNQLVYYSKFYRYSIFSLSILAAANISFNLWLIPELGLTGAAIATLLSVTCYNLFNLYLVWRKFRIQPFTRQTPLAAVLSLLALAAAWFLPSSGSDLLDIVVRSGTYALLFAILVLRFRVSPDINRLWSDLLARIKKGRQG